MYKIIQHPDQVEIIVPVKKYPVVLGFAVVAGSLTAIAMVINIVVMIVHHYFDASRFFGHILYLTFSFFFIFWLRSGKEKVLFQDGKLIVVKTCKAFTWRNTYEIN